MTPPVLVRFGSPNGRGEMIRINSSFGRQCGLPQAANSSTAIEEGWRRSVSGARARARRDRVPIGDSGPGSPVPRAFGGVPRESAELGSNSVRHGCISTR